MAIAVSLLPKVLRPMEPGIVEDEIIDVEVVWNVYRYDNGQLVKANANLYRDGHTIKMKMSEYELVKNKVL